MTRADARKALDENFGGEDENPPVAPGYGTAPRVQVHQVLQCVHAGLHPCVRLGPGAPPPARPLSSRRPPPASAHATGAAAVGIRAHGSKVHKATTRKV